MMLTDQIAAEDDVGIRHDHDGISASVSEHVAHLHEASAEIQVDRVRVDQVGKHQGLNPGFLFWLGAWSKKLQVLSPQPATHISMSNDRGSRFCKYAVASGVIEMVVRIDHVADWQIRQLADLRQQVERNTAVLKSIHDEQSVASNNKTGVATGLSAFIGNGRIDASSHLLDSEIHSSGRN